MSPSAARVDLADVSVSYPGPARPVPAVEHVDLVVDAGRAEVLVLLGPSGSGKSTLLRAIAGLEPLTGGRIEWVEQDGRRTDLATIPVHRRQFGLMFQDGALFPHRSVAGNIGYGLRRIGLSWKEQQARIDELLDLVGLAGLQQRRVGTLSGGQQQRVALARALAPRPRLLLLDEPLAALDAALRSRLLADLRAILDRTATPALFVTHDQDEAFAIADRVAVLDEGRLRQIGTPEQVWREPADAWVAGFVGYPTVLGAEHRIAGLPAGPVALRPAALFVDPAGTVTGLVRTARPTPDAIRLTVDLPRADGADPITVQAVARSMPALGAQVSLAVDPAGVAALPAGPGSSPAGRSNLAR